MRNVKEQIKAIGDIVKVKKGDLIYQIGEKLERFYYIEEGIVKIAEDSLEGKSTTISLNGPKEVFGYLDYLNHQSESTKYAVALTDCILYSIPVDQLHNAFVKEHILLDSLVEQLVKAEELNFVLSTLTVPERLRWLLAKQAVRKGNFSVVEFPLTHEEMSNLLGCSRQKISHYISKWKKEGALSNEGGTIIILDEEKLI